MEGSPGVDHPSTRTTLGESTWTQIDRWRNSPSPTKNWYSGPEGFVRMLFVSIIGMGVPAGRPYCPDGYRGGGGRTLGSGCQSATGGRRDESQPQAAAAISHFILCVSYNMMAPGAVAFSTAWLAGVWWARNALELMDRVPQSATACQDR